MAPTNPTAAPPQDFTNFPPVPEGHTRVFLNHSWGPPRGKLYGPGWAHVPDSLLPAIEAAPDIVRTDISGVALPDSTAASVNGPRGTDVGDAAIPHPERYDDDEDAELVNTDGPTNFLEAHRTAIADAAESGERTGGQSIGETGSHLDTSRTLNPQPGQFETHPAHAATLAAEADARTRAAVAKAGPTTARTGATPPAAETGDEAKPATKTALKRVGVDDLRQLAADKNVKIKDDDDKDAIVDKLYDARVSLDD
jgi:hypothetical protein